MRNASRSTLSSEILTGAWLLAVFISYFGVIVASALYWGSALYSGCFSKLVYPPLLVVGCGRLVLRRPGLSLLIGTAAWLLLYLSFEVGVLLWFRWVRPACLLVAAASAWDLRHWLL